MMTNTDNFVQCTTDTQQLPYKEFAGTMEQSPNDHRQHKLIRLSNNLQVLCTHDPHTSMAAASMTVNVGTFIDPPELPGLAHLLEHMLLMGSEKYPNEDDYNMFVSNNGGNQNASTYDSITTYHFHTAHHAMEGALDRLAAAFINPRFAPECIDREVNAVDSEYKGLQQDDEMYLQQLKKVLTSNKHPYSRFFAGNLQTLKEAAQNLNLSLHEQVAKLYQKYYSADIMNLVVAGNYSMDQLIEWTVAKFSGIQSIGNTKPYFSELPYPSNVLGKVIHYQSKNECFIMDIEFSLPQQQQFYKTKPAQYYSSLFNLETHGSLLAYLKSQGLATNIISGIFYPLHDQFNVFTIQICLTKQGCKRYEDVLKTTFAYIEMLIDKGSQEWYYKELAAKKSLDFQYYEPPMPIIWTDSTLFNAPNKFISPEHYICSEYYMNDFNANMLNDFVQHLNAQNCQVFVGAPEHSGITLDREEEYYATKYHVADLSPTITYATTFEWQHLKEIHFPCTNPFLPKNLKVVSTPKQNGATTTVPILLQKTIIHELWFKQDDQFFTPQGKVNLSILLPNANITALDWVTADVINKHINSILNELLDAALCVGMKFDISCTVHSIDAGVSGYSDQLLPILQIILKQLKSLCIGQLEFESIIVQVKQNYLSEQTKMPIAQLQYIEEFQLSQAIQFSPTELELELANVSIELVQQKINRLLDNIYYKLLVVGNFIEDDALKMSAMINSILDSQPLASNVHIPRQLIVIQPGHYKYNFRNKDTITSNNAVKVVIYVGPATNIKLMMALELIGYMMRTPFFNQLRTREQLGYSVSSFYDFYNNGGIIFGMDVQGVANPYYLVQRINHFICNFRQAIVDCTADKFNQLVQSSVGIRKEPLEDISSVSHRCWGNIKNGDYLFNGISQKIACLEELSKDELLHVWDKYINPETAAEYTRIDLQIWSVKANYSSNEILAKYPEEIWALSGCLTDIGLTNINLDELCSLALTMSLTSGVDQPVEKLKSTFPQMGKVLDAAFANRSRVKTALEMAISYAAESKHTIRSKLSMCSNGKLRQTVDGRQIIQNLHQFRAQQPIYTQPEPPFELIPKYAN